jgi:hypothetical protein
LALLGIAVVAFAAVQMWPSQSAAPAASASNSRAARKGASGTVDPASLSVRLDALQGKRPGPGAADRNPFRFQPKPPPPPPPQPKPESGGARGAAPEPPPVPAGPPPPPPIPLKFFGIVEKPGAGKVAAFTDCRSTYYGREGEVVAGQYRLVKIGIESVVMEYTDGRGRATIRLSGQECVSK